MTDTYIHIPGETLALQEWKARLKAIRRAQLGLAAVDRLELERIYTTTAQGLNYETT